MTTDELVALIENAPFPQAEKDRLITLACVADEEHKGHISTLVITFTKRINDERSAMIPKEEADKIRAKGREMQKLIRKKGEEIYRQAETGQLSNFEAQLS
ncbi:hypothetical protein HZA38_00625 [Candidatus Peregrinibacteria bacterium]|nr:hypothetical protein [Candidatus Peregrinibacteria bacterium]